ncbi:hypothetical protein BBJ28_00022021 [Nothophytophthora sp. Chile5]|nr:hypothetical protein BBJ28_00022021 [Nothophytophthora sp. Chile5]
MDPRLRSSNAGAAYYGRLIPQMSDEAEVAAALAALGVDSDGGAAASSRARAVSAARSLRNAVLPETRFYRVLQEAKLFSIDFGAPSASASTADPDEEEDADDPRRRAPSLAESDYKVVRIQEITKPSGGRTSSARSRQQMQQQQERHAYSVVKMPEEVVASSGRLQCLFGVANAPTWFIRLAHVENAFMMLSTKETSKTMEAGVAGETQFLEQLPENEEAVTASGRFYFRVLVPIELRKAPDLLAPVISRHVFKNAEEIIECHETYRCPQSGVTFVKLAYEDGWLFETLNSGIKVLERLATEPAIEYGHFFYVVKIPVGIRVAPHIMAQRAGKGFKLHSIVEASQRFTPPGSKITYVRVCKDKNSRCGCSRSHAGSAVSPRSAAKVVPARKSSNDSAEEEGASSNGASFLPLTAMPSCHGGWIFETTMDGQVVLDPMAEPKVRQVERLFYRVLEDVDVLPTPAGDSKMRDSSPAKEMTQQAPSSPPGRRKRLMDTLIECSERIVPATPPVAAVAGDSEVPEIGFVKLRHDVGWICERQTEPPFRLMLEQVQGFAVTRDLPKFYRVLVPVYLRSAPDFECPRLPGVAPMTAGTVFESSLQYTPPGSRITYIKVASESHPTTSSTCNGWLFDQTPSGDQVLEAVDEDPEKKNGKFFFRVVSEKKEVLLSPESTSEVVRYLFANTIISAEMEYTLPRTQETYVRLTKEKGWVALDAPRPRTSSFSLRPSSRGAFDMHPPQQSEGENEGLPRTLVRISEELYNLYAMPPSWVSIGFPSRTWFKVPDEGCRTILAEETLLQMQVFEARNMLASCSQGRDGVPLSRKGTLSLDNGEAVWKCTLEEIKHSASALLFTFPWKQVWWIFEIEGPEDRHCVELQHALRGGFRSILFDGECLVQNRSVTDMLWDSGSEFSFTWGAHTFKVLITLEGAFFSQYLQFYSYTLLVDEEEIAPLEQY